MNVIGVISRKQLETSKYK